MAVGSHAGTLAVPFLRRRHIWQHKETCIARVEGEAGGAGDEGRMQKCWHESCCSIAAHAHTLTNSMAREPASSHPWKQKLSPLNRLQTLRQTNCQGGHGQPAFRCGVVLREESIAARPFVPLSPGTCFCFWQGACHSHQKAITRCLPTFSGRSTHSAARTESCLARLPAVHQRERAGVPCVG